MARTNATEYMTTRCVLRKGQLNEIPKSIMRVSHIEGGAISEAEQFYFRKPSCLDIMRMIIEYSGRRGGLQEYAPTHTVGAKAGM